MRKPRRGRKSGAHERHTKKCNHRKKGKGDLRGAPPPSSHPEKLRTIPATSFQERHAAYNPINSVEEEANPATIITDLRAEVSRLAEQLNAARLEIDCARAHLHDFTQSSQVAQLQAYNDGFVAGMAVAAQNTAEMAMTTIAARDEQIAGLQAQLTEAKASAAAAAKTRPAKKATELQAQLSDALAAFSSEKTRNISLELLYDDTLRLLQEAGRMKLCRKVEQLREEYGLNDYLDSDGSYEEDSDSSADAE